MADLTPILNELLKSHDARPTVDPSLCLKNIDEFLKEAYRIVRLLMSSPVPNTPANHLTEHPHRIPQHLPQRHPAILPLQRPSPPTNLRRQTHPVHTPHRPPEGRSRRRDQATAARAQRQHPQPRRRRAAAPEHRDLPHQEEVRAPGPGGYWIMGGGRYRAHEVPRSGAG